MSHERFGGPFTAPQLKVIAEVCSLVTFAIFSTLVLKEKLRWVDLGAFGLILAGVLLSLLTKPAGKVEALPPPLPLPEPQPGPGMQGTPPPTDVQFVVGRKMLVDGAGSGGNSGGGGKLRLEVVADGQGGARKGSILSTS